MLIFCKRKQGLASKLFARVALILAVGLSCSFNASAIEPLEVRPPTPLAVKITAGCLDLAAASGPVLKTCRPYLASRAVGTSDWTEEYGSYMVIATQDNRLTLSAVFANATATVIIDQDSAGRTTFSGHLVSTSDKPLELARFHYLDGLVCDPAMNLLSMRQYELAGRIIKPSETLPAPRAACQRGWGGVYWPRLPDPIHDRPNTAISGDCGMLAPDWNSEGFFFGFTAPGEAFGELGIRTAEEKTPFFLAVLLDAVRLDPGKTRGLENVLVTFGDVQDELRYWIGVCADHLGPARVRPPLAGYCSWYQKGTDVQPDDIRRALASFESFEAPPGGRTIQIDDGYQVCPGDWSGRGDWKDQLDKLPKEIAARGFIPGLWIAPTAIHASHPIVREHPEWLQRDADGEFCIRFNNWRRFNGMSDAKTYFLEPDHPEARDFILTTLGELRGTGWEYFKIDFAYTVSSNRVKYDPYKTTFQSLKSQWELFRLGLGQDALINSCGGGIWRYTLGAVDISRIGGDIGGSMNKLSRNMSEMVLRANANGMWFQADPDVFYMRSENSSLNFEQSCLLTGTQGLLGTAFLTSDFADQWSPQAREVVKTYWNRQGPSVPARLRALLDAEGLPAAIVAAYGQGEYIVAVYNWSTAARDISIRLTDLRLPGAKNCTALLIGTGSESIRLSEDVLTITDQPGQSMRTIHLQLPYTDGFVRLSK
jgi:hypothetical protein